MFSCSMRPESERSAWISSFEQLSFLSSAWFKNFRTHMLFEFAIRAWYTTENPPRPTSKRSVKFFRVKASCCGWRVRVFLAPPDLRLFSLSVPSPAFFITRPLRTRSIFTFLALVLGLLFSVGSCLTFILTVLKPQSRQFLRVCVCVSDWSWLY